MTGMRGCHQKVLAAMRASDRETHGRSITPSGEKSNYQLRVSALPSGYGDVLGKLP